MASNKFIESPFSAVTESLQSQKFELPPLPEQKPPQPAVEAASPRIKSDSYLPPEDIRPVFEAAAREFDVPVNVLMALGHQESRYNANAVGPATKWGRAKGMMQYLESTAQGLGINPFDPNEAIPAAAKQIRERLDKGYSMEDAVKEHFAGPDRKLWGEKTNIYGREVMDKVGRIGELMGAGAAGPAASQKTAEADEPGRYVPLTLEQVKLLEQGKDPFASAAPSADPEKQKAIDERGLFDRSTDGWNRGMESVGQSLSTARFALAGGDSGELAKALSEKFAREQAREKTTGEKKIDDAFQKVTDAEGVLETLKAGAGAVGTALANPKDLAVGIVEQMPNMLPTIAGGVGGAGAGGLAGAGVGALAAGVGAAPGAAAGAVWGGRAGMLAGTTATELGAEVEQMVLERLQENKAAPTEQNIKALLDDAAFQSEARERGLKKGLTVGVIDQIFMGLGGKVAGKAIAAPTVGRKVALGAGAVGLDAVGETTGEAASQYVARGKVDAGDALREGVYGLGQSVVEPAIGAAMQGAKRVAGAPAAPSADIGAGSGDAPAATMPPAATPSQPAAQTVTVTPPQPSQASGPLTRAMENAAEQPQRVTVTAPEGQITGFLQSRTEDGNGNSVTRVLGDDGQVYTFTSADGVTIAPEPGPLSGALEKAAEQQPAEAEIPATEQNQAVTTDIRGSQTANIEQPADVQTAQAETAQERAEASPPPAAEQRAEQKPEPRLEDMSEPELRARLKYIASQGKTNGWNAMLTSERKKVEREINKRVADAKAVEAKKAEEPKTEAIDLTGRTDQQLEYLSTNGQPGFKEAAIAELQRRKGEVNGRNATGVSLGNVVVQSPEVATAKQEDQQGAGAGDRATDAFRGAVAGQPEAGTGAAVSGADSAADAQPALKDEYAGKWFGSKGKAEAFLAKKKAGATHEVVQTGEVRFEVKPKQADAPITVNTTVVEREKQKDKYAEIEAGFAANREAMKGLKVGDEVSYVAKGTYTQKDGTKIVDPVRTGKVTKVQDTDQGMILIDGNITIGARHLTKAKKEPDTSLLPKSESKAVNDFLEGKRDAAPTVEGVAARDADEAQREQPDEGAAKRKAQAQKMRDAAQKIIAAAEAEQTRDRNTNTARRASMAAGSIAQAAANEAIGKTMANLADAIESGDAQAVSGLTSRAAVELMDRIVRSAIQKADAKLTYSEQQRVKGRAFQDSDITFVEYPAAKFSVDGSKSSVLEALKGKRGGPALADKIRYREDIDTGTYDAIEAIIGKDKMRSAVGWWAAEQRDNAKRLQRAGIHDLDQLRAAIKEYNLFRSGRREIDPIKKAEMAIVGKKVGFDFFPTPKALASRMAELAGVEAGMTVLEPSAGNGNIADAAKAAGADVEVIELSSQLRDILSAKGYAILDHDFEQFEAAKEYDAVLMNPPFSDRKDADHIMRAYGMVKPGGKLVAIAGEGVFFGSDKKAVAFREWLDERGADVEKLPPNTFKGSDLAAQTSTNARLIVLEKPAETSTQAPVNDQAAADTGIAEPVELEAEAAADEVQAEPAQESAETERPSPAAEEKPAKKRKSSAKAAEPAETETDSNTGDAGAELTYNRRNRTAGRLKWEDVSDKEAALRVKEVTKAKVYPKPDYVELAEQTSPLIAHLVKQAYDAIASTPALARNAAPTDADLQAYISAVQRVMDGVSAWAKDAVFVTENRPEANGKTLLDTIYPGGWRDNRTEIMMLGGNKFLGALQPGYDERMRANRDIKKGWPAKREAWQAQGYRVVETKDVAKVRPTNVDGKYYISIAGNFATSFPSEAEANAALEKMQPWLLLNKNNRVVGDFATQEDAIDAAREKSKRAGKEGEVSEKGISVEMAEREGVSRRVEGEDITSERLMADFGFRGINFGNWMKGKANEAERQLHLNHAYDSFMDLSDILGVPPKAISLNGMLGIAFGAQGKGGRAAAHFVPGVNEINITRTAGAGAVAHEWAHALDHYFARQAGLDREADPFLTEHTNRQKRGRAVVENGRQVMKYDKEPYADTIRPEIIEKFKVIVKAMNKREMTAGEVETRKQASIAGAKKSVDNWLASIKRDFTSPSLKSAGKAVSEADFDALAERIRKLDLGDGSVAISKYNYISPVVDSLRALYKKATGRSYSIDNIKGLQAWVDSLKHLSESKQDDKAHVPQMATTTFAGNAAKLDNDKGGKKYWSTDLEKFARAFDAFVGDQLSEKAVKNTYLSGLNNDERTSPMGDERKAINAAIKDLIDTIETKQEEGREIMFSVADQQERQPRPLTKADTPITALTEFLSRNPEFFEYKTPVSQDIEGIAAEIDPGYKVKEFGQVLAKQRGVDRIWDVQVPNSVRSAEIVEKNGEVWIDVSKLQAGKDSGSRIYAIAAAYAHNNGKVLVGDPAGLSRQAFFRRTENVLASALKYGTTRHLRPHVAQEIPGDYYRAEGHGGWGDKVRAINWNEGDDVGNIKELIYTAYKSAVDNVPELKNVVFDPEQNRFTTLEGRPFTGEDFDRVVSEHAARKSGPYSLGSRTAKRTALFNTLLRQQSQEARKRVLDQFGDLLSRGGLKEGPLQRVMYSVGEDGKVVAEFGPVHTEFKDDPAGAIDRLMQDKTGEAIVSHPDLGEISLVYGNDSYGLAHIADRRGEDFLARLPKLIKEGGVYSKDNQNGRVFLGTDKKEATIRLDWNGKAKTWLVSAYEKHPDLTAEQSPRESVRSEVVEARSGLSAEALRDAIETGMTGPIVGRMIDDGMIVLHADEKTLPAGAKGVRGVQAVTLPNGQIHLVASSLTKDNARAVLLHEMFHAGGEMAISSKEWSNLQGRLGSLYRQSEKASGKAREIFDRARARVASAKKQGAVSTRMEVEEFGAYIIEEYERAPNSLPAAMRKWVEDVIGFVKAWTVARFGKQLGDVTPAQLAAIAKAALMNAYVLRDEIAASRMSQQEKFSASGAGARSERPSKVFGREIAPLAIRAYKSLSYDAKRIVDGWNMNWDRGQHVLTENAEIQAAFEPVRAKLRELYGDTVPAYRGERQDGNASGADRSLFSWSPIKELALSYGINRTRGMPPEITQAQVDEQIENYRKHGIARMLGNKYVRSPMPDWITDEPDYYQIYHGNQHLTDGTDIAKELQSEKEDRDEWRDRIRENGKLYFAEVPVDNIVWIPTGINLTHPELIARYNPRTDSAENVRFSVTPEEADKALTEASDALDAPKAKDDYIGRVVGDISLGARLLNHPRQVAAVHPEFTPVYRTAISQMETRDKIIADFGADVKAYDHLDQAGKENVNKVLELGRLTSTVYTPEELQNGVGNSGEKQVVTLVDGKPKVTTVPYQALLTETGEVVKLSDEEIEAYQDLRSMFDRALDRLRDQTLTEMGFGGFSRMEGMKPLVIEDGDDGKIILKGSVYTDEERAVMRTGNKEEIRKVLQRNPIMAIIKKFDGAQWNPEKFGYEFDARQRDALEKEMGSYLRKSAAAQILELIDDTTPADKAERLRNIASFVAEIEQAKRAGYVPFARYGDYVVTVKEKVADVTYVEDDAEHYIAKGLPDSFAADLQEMGAEETKEGWRIKKSQKADVERMTEQTVYSTKVDVGLGDAMAVRKAKQVSDIPAVAEAIEKAKAEWVADNPNRRIVAFKVRDKKPDQPVKLSDVDALAEVASIDNATWDAIRDKLADAIKAKGFRRHFFHSDNVPGYTGDFERSIADYVIGMSGYLSRRQHMKRWDNAVSSINDKPKLFEYASKYRNYVNDPQEELAMIRQIGFFSYIAGVMASAFANLTQVPLLTMPTLSQIAPAPLVMKELTRAYKDAAKMLSMSQGLDMFDPEKAPEDVREILKEAWAEGSFVPLESFDLMMTARQRNVGARKGVKAFNTTTQVVSLAFTFAERMNRLVTFIAAARIAEKKAVQENAKKVLSGDALARAEVLRNWNPKSFAEWAVDESQYRMGKANRPTVMRGVGAAILQFKGFMMQTFEAWYRMAALHGPEGKKAAAASILALYAFAGIWGLPGADDLRKLLENIYKQITDKDLDLKTELRAWIAKKSGSNALALMVNKGMPYPLGVDLTRVGMGSVAPNSPLAAAGIPFDMLIGRPKRAFEKASVGDELGAAAELTPNFIKHWLVAGSWATEGVRDSKGNRILLPKDLSAADLAMKSLGFQPSIVTDVRDYEYAQRRMETAVDALKRNYTAKLARAIVELEGTTDPKEQKKIDDRIGEIYADIAKHNETAGPEQIIKIDNRALRSRIMRESEGVKSTWGKERKAAREASRGLREVFGLSHENDE